MFVALAHLAVVVAPLRLTLWVLAVATLAIVVLIAIGVSRHFESVGAERQCWSPIGDDPPQRGDSRAAREGRAPLTR